MSAGEAIAGTAVSTDEQRRQDGLRRHLRGSSLLLAGRVASLVINLGVQVATVRWLTRDEYGMFAYALVTVAGVTQVVLLGLDDTVARFVALDHERNDLPRAFGAIALAVAGVALAGVLAVAGCVAARGVLPGLLGVEPEAVGLLCAMIVMAPLQALDAVLHAVYGVFGRARSIMVRRHIVGPGLKLASVLAVIALHGGALALAWVYTATLAAGVGVYALLLLELLGQQGHFERWRPRRLVIPWREMLGYAASLITAEIVFLFYSTFITMILQYYRDASHVAGFQAARPFAKLIDVALVTFVHLFVPSLARFYGRGDREGIERLYVQTCAWVSVLSFPLFAVTYGMSDSLAVLLLGDRYADAGSLLALMSLGFFVHSALGANPHALRVLGYVRTAVAVDLLAVAIALAIGFTLIPLGGEFGAAVTLCLVLCVRGGLYLAALRWCSGLDPLRGPRSIYAALLAGTLALSLARPLVQGSLVASGLVTGAVVVAVLAHARRRLALHETFPELARFPLLGSLFR